MKTVLLTGGLGFIGSHTAVKLLENGYNITIIDNLTNSKIEVLHKIRKIAHSRGIVFVKDDVCRQSLLEVLRQNNRIDAVIHFAGYKSVGESVNNPYVYYKNNLVSTMRLLEFMYDYDIKNIIFSSSATVYDKLESTPYRELSKTGNCSNPYGWTKYMNERIITDTINSWEGFKSVLLRYFNPIGAHPSGLLGEVPNGIPNNLVPYIAQVATGKRDKLYVYGNDYCTKDGTGIRDYIHIMDLADAHVKALDYMLNNDIKTEVFNIGTGVGYSVLDVIKAYEKANNIKIPYEIVARRPGDIDKCYADNTKAKELLNWEPKYNLENMCRDSYNFQLNYKG